MQVEKKSSGIERRDKVDFDGHLIGECLQTESNQNEINRKTHIHFDGCRSTNYKL